MDTSVKRLTTFIAITTILGLALSLYSYYLVIKLEEDDEYEAFCDFTDTISCTKVHQSEYSHGFGLIAPYLGSDSPLNLPNGIFEALFYTAQLILGFSTNPLAINTQVILLILSNGIYVWLAYVLLHILQGLCVLCGSLYAINVIISILAIIRCQRIRQSQSSTTSVGTKKKAPAKKVRSKKD